MANLPYPIYGTITASDDSTPNTKVVLRNDRTGETTNTTSNTSGQYVLESANFTSGYMESDRVTVIVGYGDEEGSGSILISSGTHNIDITLAAIAESTDTTLCQIQDVLDELGDKTTDDISYERVRKTILRAEAEIDERTNTKFASTTVTEEIYDFNQNTGWKSADQLRGGRTNMLVGTRNDYNNTNYNDRIRLDHFPIISITSLYKNSQGPSSADSWTELTEQEGSGGDFVVYNDTGTIQFVNNLPATGTRKIKVTYTYGTSTVPKTVEKLCILLSVRDILMSKANDNIHTDIDGMSLKGYSESKGISGTVTYFTWLIEEIERLWKIIGDLAQGVA